MELLFVAGLGLATVVTTITATHFAGKSMERRGTSEFSRHQRKAKRRAKR